MARQRLSRKELLQQPDQFITRSAAAIGWAKQHLTHLLYGVVGVLVVLGLGLGWSTWQQHRNRRAAVLLYEAVQLLKPADKTPGMPDVQQSVGQLEVLLRDYGRTSSAALAHWYLGHIHFQQGDYASALVSYEQARRGLRQGRELLTATLITLDIAYAQEATGEYEQAIANYAVVQNVAAPWLHGEAFLGMGRCYEHKGALDKALAVYERALAVPHVADEVRQIISERLAQLQPPEEPSVPPVPQKNPGTSTTGPSTSSQGVPSSAKP